MPAIIRRLWKALRMFYHTRILAEGYQERDRWHFGRKP